MNEVIKVLFVCTHNAGRSQMAEALLRKLGGPSFDVTSAGFQPRPVNPIVVEAMALIGIDISDATSKSVSNVLQSGRDFDYVITVDDAASFDRCPVFPGVAHRLGWSFRDPNEFEGNHEQQLSQVIQLRDAIRARIDTWSKKLPFVSRALYESERLNA